jgi:hypothetical protein
MRWTTVGICAGAALVVAGCGGGGKFANEPRPATPIDLSVYINNSRVSVSPAAAGAGEIIFIVTNQADSTQSLTVHPTSNSSRQLANTGPIQPQATAQVTVDLSNPGDYTVSTAASGQTEADLAKATKIHPAALHIGPARASSSNVLLQP